MNSKGNNVADAIMAEVEKNWPDCVVDIVESKGHPKAKLTFGGKIMNVVFSGTPGSSNSVHHTLADVRRTLRKLGATRAAPDPTPEEDEAPYHKPNDGAAKRQPIMVSGPADPRPSVAEKLTTAGLVIPAPKPGGRDIEALFTPDPADDRDADDELRAAFMARVEGIVDGVYFGLPEDVYHSVPRLSSSGIQKLCVSPATFWRGSWLDPQRPDHDEEQTIFQLLGKAYHVARLEPHLFEQTYVRELDKADAPKGTLFTGTDMGRVLEEYGLKKSGTVAEQAERLADAGFAPEQLWPVVKAQWDADRGTRIGLSAKHYDALVTDMERIIQCGPVAELLTGGEAEVSVFWTDDYGIKMKSRLDYLTRDWLVDLKSFDNSRGKSLNQCLIDAVRYNRYFLQATVYREAVEAIRMEGLPVIEAQTDDQRNLIAALQIKPAELRFWFVFQEKGGVPNLIAREFPFYMVPYTTIFNEQVTDDQARRDAVREATKRRTMIFTRGQHEVLNAKKAFALNCEIYQPGKPWLPLDPVGAFSDDDWPPYWLEGGN